MIKRIKWSIKVGCLFLALAGLWFNEPLAIFYKRVVAESFNAHLTPYPIADLRPQAPISGRIIQVALPKMRINLDVGQINIAAKPQSCTVGYAYSMALPINSQTGNAALTSSEPVSIENLQIGDLAYVITDTGHRFNYQLRTVVAASDDFVLPDNGPPTMTLQFCNNPRAGLLLFDLLEVR
jgi:hypothetical protein